MKVEYLLSDRLSTRTMVMRTIEEVVKKKLKSETLNKARFLDSDSKTIHGYEAFKLPQKPCDN